VFGPTNSPSLDRLKSLLKNETLDDGDRAMVTQLIRQGEARKAYSPFVSQPAVPAVMREDLLLLDGAPDLRMIPGVLTVWEIGGALRDQRLARGNPALIQVFEANSQVAGTATSLGYTVPLLRQSRIDKVSINFQNTAALTETGIWVKAFITVTPFLGIASQMKAVNLSARQAWDEGPTTLVFDGPIFLNAGDAVNSVMIQRTGDPAVIAWDMTSSFFGLEVDVGYGFEAFPG